MLLDMRGPDGRPRPWSYKAKVYAYAALRVVESVARDEETWAIVIAAAICFAYHGCR